MTKSSNLDIYIEPDIVVDVSKDPVPSFVVSSKEELNKKIMEAHEDVLAGRVKPVEQVFAELIEASPG